MAMEFNHSKLLGRIRECGLTQEQLAKAIGISAFSLSKKLKNKSKSDSAAMLAIGKVLNIPLDEFGEYFFTV
jgi:transcriptional regulator with XRE-family HTH domain